MKSLNEYIIEKILINKSSKFINKIKVESKDKLQSIIMERYNGNKSFIDLTDIDVSELDDLSGIFFGLNIKVADISGWDTSNVKFMKDMFAKCNKLKNIIGIENLDVSKLEDASCMFYGCENLVELDLTNWNPISLEIAWNMFYNCSNLKIIKNIENWQLTNIKEVSYMFYYCAKLDVDLSNWDLTNIKKSFKIGIVGNSHITKNHYPKLN